MDRPLRGCLNARILIVDSAPEAARTLLAEHGGESRSDNYAAALRSQSRGLFDAIDFSVVFAGDCETLPQNVSFSDFHGIVWTGSPLNAYGPGAVIKHQVDFALAAFQSGVPGFGSCWGMQVMSTALGGRVHLHPRGFEFGIARQIRLSEVGQNHAMYQGKSAVFDALCSHEDEVCVPPPGAVVLAGNDHSAIQAIAYDDDAHSFWGVQYHPEYDLKQMAALFSRAATRMVEDGLVRNSDDVKVLAEDFRALQQNPTRKDIAWRYGLGPDITNNLQHGTELRNWLRVEVTPAASRSSE
jgi:GMP synthase (glutamine-hydrolysing)